MAAKVGPALGALLVGFLRKGPAPARTFRTEYFYIKIY